MTFVLFLLVGCHAIHMNRHFLTNAAARLATCNDGSPPAYFVRRNSSSTTWQIHLRGGGGCYNLASCQDRFENNLDLMTSNLTTATMSMTGILSDDCDMNPALCDANTVHIHFCTSDWWSGNSSIDSRHSVTSSSSPWSFLGRNVVHEVILDLFSYHDLGTGKVVYFTGSSAGGVGVWTNSDSVGTLVRSKIPDVEYGVISGCSWFLLGQGYANYSCTEWHKCNMEDRIQIGSDMWSLSPHEECAAIMGPFEDWKCLFGSYVYPVIRSRKLAVVYLYDMWQAMEDGIYVQSEQSLDDSQRAFVNQRGTQMHKSLVKDSVFYHGVYGLACYDHVVLHKVAYSKSKTIKSGKTASDAVLEWVNGGTPYYVDFCETLGCNPSCVRKCGI